MKREGGRRGEKIERIGDREGEKGKREGYI